MDKYFEYEEIEEDKKVKFVVTRLKCHASLWWESIQVERRNRNKLMINNWDQMVTKLKGKFLPKDYQLTLYRQVKNIKQRGMTVREYNEEFYKVNLKDGYIEDIVEKIDRYLNGLRIEIRDEIILLYP